MSKIITTIGPSSIERATLINLKKAGATDFRVNLSHSNSDLLEKYFKEIMQCGLQPAIDTQGPQLRTTITPHDSYFHSDQQFYLSASTTQLTPVSSTVQINHSEFFKFVQLGDLVRIDFDGLVPTDISDPNVSFILEKLCMQKYFRIYIRRGKKSS